MSQEIPIVGRAEGGLSWHEMVDQLERLFRNEVPSHRYDQLCDFYLGYLKDQIRLLDMVHCSTWYREWKKMVINN